MKEVLLFWGSVFTILFVLLYLAPEWLIAVFVITLGILILCAIAAT